MKFELATLTDYSEDALIEEIQRVASLLSGKRMTHAEFNKFARVHSSTVRTKFGSWPNALVKAGVNKEEGHPIKTVSRAMLLETARGFYEEFGRSPKVEEIAKKLAFHKTSITRKFGRWAEVLQEIDLKPVALGRRYTEEECCENVLDLWMHYGRQPHFAELNQPPSMVGSKAYVNRWGGWRNALSAIVVILNRPENKSVELTSLHNEQTPTPPDFTAGKQKIHPRTISLSLRYKVLRRDNFCCVICGRSPAKVQGIELHVDHLVPWSRSGESIESNLRTLCFDCNLGKGAKIESLANQ